MNAESAWQATLGQLQMEMPKPAFDTWVRNTELISCEDGNFTIGVQNAYARDWLESRLSSTVTKLLTGSMNRAVSVQFIVLQKDGIPLAESTGDDESVEISHTSNQKSAELLSVNNRYTFENFVVGAGNRLAHAACMAVAENPARAYNPLFLYGGVGLGKTHLLHAIGNAYRNRNLQVLYVSSEEFTNDFINSIRAHTSQAFRDKYRRIDILLLDDIQFIANKEQTQEEFFHTFNTLHGQDKQIVITSDRPPKSLVNLEERLRSRVEWGLIADIQPPDLETRLAILHTKAERAGREVPEDILYVIARRVQSNIRELEGALNRVLAFSDLSGLPLTSQLVESALADLLPHKHQVSPEHVIKAVAVAFGVDPKEMLGRDRSRDVALPRQVAMYMLREDANISLPQIGDALGGRDHTTVMYACDKIADLLERDDRLRRKIVNIREQLFGLSHLAV
jgi:chromosomal replication initiator protein